MEDFLKKVLQSGKATPPDPCQVSFETNFHGAINIEWFEKEGHFEAIFYKDQIEHIAQFATGGTLIKYKMHLSKELLPKSIKQELERDKEIMSVVLINEGNSIIYEVIVRDQALHRFVLRINQLGKHLSKQPL